MKTAKELFNITNNAKLERIEQIYDKLEEAARETRFEQSFDERLEDYITDALAANGFKVETSARGTKVSWKTGGVTKP